MLWIVLDTASHAIIACNLHHDEEAKVWQLWVTRANGKSLKIAENQNRAPIATMRDAIDYAIENGDPVLRLV